jgi:putative nucleotidyltransferase with HDIG domain
VNVLERVVARMRGRRSLRRFSPQRARGPARPGRPLPLQQSSEKALVAVGAAALAAFLLGVGAGLGEAAWIGLAALVGVLAVGFSSTLIDFQRRALLSLPRVAVLAGVLLAPIGLALAGELLLGVTQPAYVPLALVSLTIGIVFSRELALVATVALGALMGLLVLVRPGWGEHAGELLVCLSGAFVAALHSSSIRRRGTLVRVGLVVGVVQATVAGALLLLSGSAALEQGALVELGALVLSGLLTGVIVTGALPAIEVLFDVTTDVSLLELGNTNERPLLRKLLLEAPGTYHHSYIVGLLSEAAAEAVGANPLLARVGGLYHDVGKLNKPSYFAENSTDARARHRELAPEMSTLVISSHTRDGIEIGSYYGLPTVLLSFMTEHHGTSCIEYFFHQAKRLRGEEQVDESAFRYPGPKPQRPETAIVMIADAVEAISRQMPEPTQQRLRQMVHEVVLKRLLDGQFDECGITLRDLARVEEACVRVLVGIYHTRPTFPKGRPHPLDLSQPAEQREDGPGGGRREAGRA